MIKLYFLISVKLVKINLLKETGGQGLPGVCKYSMGFSYILFLLESRKIHSTSTNKNGSSHASDVGMDLTEGGIQYGFSLGFPVFRSKPGEDLDF